ncbi:MAG: hypothetical protein ACFNZ2_03670 [Prevotella histicola]
MRRGGRHLVFILFMVLLMSFLLAHTHVIRDKVLKLQVLLMGFLIAQAHEINPLLQGNTMLFNADNHNIYL